MGLRLHVRPGTRFIGTTGFFLQGLPETYGSTGVPLLAFWVFQFAFADTCSTITSGAMVGRSGFIGDLLYSIGVTGFIYPIIGHWAWGPDGWLARSAGRFRDFAGSTVVHTIGGAIALAGAIALGPRLGRVFKRDGGGPPPAHDMIIGAVGGLILWFGWYGFNPGSTLSAMDMQGIGRVPFNTTLAACSGGLAALFYSYVRSKKWDLRPDGQRLPGRPRGDHLPVLLGRARSAHSSSASVAGVVVVWAIDLLEYLRDRRPDRRGAGAHGVRHLGHAVLGLFATGQYGAADADRRGHDDASVTGLFYGGGVDTADRAGHRQRGRHGRDVRRRRSRSCTRSRPPARCVSRRKASSKGWTSTSTARRPIPNI